MHYQPRLTVLVLEYVTAGGFVGLDLPSSLRNEGLLMRDALINDLTELGWDCITTYDERLSPPANSQSMAVNDTTDVKHTWQTLMHAPEVDAIWVIAPESENILLDLAQMAQVSKKRYIGCEMEAIRITSSKRVTANYFGAHGISVIDTYSLPDFLADSSLAHHLADGAWVLKPDDGAGCADTYYFTNAIELRAWCAEQLPQAFANMVVQPYIVGQALSISVVASIQQAHVLSANVQFINIQDGQFYYSGVGIHQAQRYLPELQTLATRIYQALPSLTAYWGADIIRTALGQYVLVEINPRLTTPYVKLHSALASNPAKIIYEAVVNNNILAYHASHAFDWHLNCST